MVTKMRLVALAGVSTLIFGASFLHGAVEDRKKELFFSLPAMPVVAALRSSSFAEPEYVDVKCEDGALNFYFNHEKSRKDQAFAVARSGAIALAGAAVAFAGVVAAMQYDKKWLFAPAGLGVLCAGYGVVDILLRWMIIRESKQKGRDKPFRVVDRKGINDEMCGVIKWTEIEKVVVHSDPRAIFSGVVITLLPKANGKKVEQRIIYGSLTGMVALAGILLQGKEQFAKTEAT